MELSQADNLLLNALQSNASRSQSDLAEIAGMSRSSVWRRIRDFEDDGLIASQVTLLNPQKAGFQIQVLLSVAMAEHDSRHEFERHIAALPEVTECFSVSGERDYVLQVIVRDMDAYNQFLNAQILAHAAVRSASSTFVLRRIKYTTAIPLTV